LVSDWLAVFVNLVRLRRARYVHLQTAGVAQIVDLFVDDACYDGSHLWKAVQIYLAILPNHRCDFYLNSRPSEELEEAALLGIS